MKNALRLLTMLAVFAVPAGHAATIVESYSSGVLNTSIPDGNPSGLANVINIPLSAIGSIEEVSVSLNITGSWNGDLYVTLQHASGFAVLLNRVGTTGGDAFGYGDGGFNIVLNDLGGFDDVHSYQGFVGSQSPLTGSWGSDGRLVDPNVVTDTDPRTAQLDSFAGGNANGDWTLFVADLSGGATHTLVDWSVELKGVPEPGTTSLLVLGSLFVFRRRRRLQ